MRNATRHLRAVPNSAEQVPADREIAVRFSSTSGLILPRPRPLNSFRWVGPATLRFSAHGVVVIARRATLFGLRQTQRFIPPAEIRDVYREANAVQVHLRGSRSAYFRLWAVDSASAAQIVSLLPTTHTIEFENAVDEPQLSSDPRVPAVWWVASLLVAALGVFAWVAAHRGGMPPSPVVPAQLTPRPPPTTTLPAVATSADALLAELDLMRFNQRIEALKLQFDTAWNALMDGRVSQRDFANELDDSLRPQWDELEAIVRRTNAAPDSLRQRADSELMATINNWQLAERGYADDLRHQRQVIEPFEYFRRAELHRLRALRLQDDLEAPAASVRAPTMTAH